MAISEMTDKLGLQSLRSRTVSAELAWLLILASLIVYHKNNFCKGKGSFYLFL